MPYTARFHPLVEKDYAEAYEWYEDRSTGLGDRFLIAVREKIEKIAAHSEVYSSKGRNKYREAIVENFPFIIVFKIYRRKQEIFISSIHHAKKHPKSKYR